MTGVILSVDIGTSALKAALIDFGGKLRAFTRLPYGGNAAQPGALAWEGALARALGEFRSGGAGCIPQGVCISGNGPTLVPVTFEGAVLEPLYWHDRRVVSLPQAAPGAASLFLPHAAWFRGVRPADYGRVRFFISSHEWLASRLGAAVVTALPQWAYEPYYWDDDQCRLFGLDREKFPPFVKMGERIGQVSPAAARGAGGFLPAGTPIIAGGPDFITALLGVAAQKRGDVCDRAGTSEGINVCTPEKPDLSGPAGGPRGGLDGLRALPHAKEGWWNLGALIASSGRLFEWYRTLTGQADRDYGDHLAELIPGSPEEGGRGFFFPPSQAAGSAGTAPGGARSPGFLSYTGEGPLALPDKTTLGRSVLEAMAFAVRTAAEVLESRGFPVRHLRVSGGQGKNRRWNQLKADITGRSLMVGEIPDGELAGNAVLAAATLGNTGGHTAAAIEEAAAGMIRFRDVYEPCGKTAAFWDERFERYRELAGLLAGHQADSSAGGELRS